MKAIQCKAFGPIDDLALADIPIPDPGPGQLRVAVHAASVNFFDLLMIRGQYQFKPTLPFTPGAEAAGEVIALGDGVSGFAIGDRVAIGGQAGAFAEQAIVAVGRAHRLPDGVSYDVAAAYRGTYGTAYYALRDRALLQPGEVLLVHGASGGTGLAAVELGRVMGARVIGTVGGAAKADIVRDHGAETVLIYGGGERLRDQVKAATGGKGADVIFDVVGGDVFDESLRCINWYGRLLVIGFTSGRIPAAPTNLTLLKSCSVVGVFFGAWCDREPEAARALNQTLLDWIAEGRIKPHVSARFPLSDSVAAMRTLAERKAIGKVVITCR
ncbi:MAG: NADPH:quinone oxidoreductase family protein [Alphaproteobacteria bacterium]|nr:NADPH:quinone oxidoreductase family protein [Alphaproteobacteria bacterium]MDP6515179.1 NADPH:quinone oxidoreductase family protein [Alphaproteobacteria bacterium]